MSLAIHLPPREDQTAFNLAAWERITVDPALAKIEGRIESDRHGHIIMSPPAGYDHSGRQFEIGYQLRRLLGGNVRTECALSTADGVKGLDVIWMSEERAKNARSGQLLVRAPEICVEVLSPSNTAKEIEEKTALYFDAGADEVWICDLEGVIHFHGPDGLLGSSAICPDFPRRIEA